ncbi:GRAM domain-containing protein [Cordyceps fumosorosea ARSEF 2679]|uniref:GRAM domain-containing protein n=1 Tax=Cordyceps fumosorosea (strain ARSEF 2679) TaxID=1081104 RepID=A0A167U7Y8_CORFA|nr:GRAM domain-containing protein [Cordyceps fumosorosea ARSEF 2679]OAA61319.1 GRAM domain-containing protein [Cordyceps fumosorosea ARSEF 2679]
MESQNGLGKLLPKSLSARRKQRSKKSKSPDGDSADDATRKDQRPSSSSNLSLYVDDHNDEREFTDEADDGSFASYESSADANRSGEPPRPSSSSRPVRPVPSNHPSLVGYLTTSSPAVQAAHLDSPPKIRPSSRNSRSPWRRGSKNDKADTPDTVSSVKFPDLPAPARLAAPDQETRGKTPSVDVDVPRTPPNSDKPGPVIVNTPPTPTEAGLGFGQALTSSPEKRSTGVATRSPAETGSPTQNMNIHRRSKSGGAAIGPSKLSNITSAPLTPGAEAESGSITPSATGFFSSVISAAQSAATTLSNNIPGTGISMGGQKNKTASFKSLSVEAVDQLEDDSSVTSQQNKDEMVQSHGRAMQRSSAIQTLGAGELSLSQLGLSDAPSNVASPASARFPDVVDTRARSESAPVEPHSELPSDEPVSRPRSAIESANDDDFVQSQTDLAGPNRSSSVRSAVKPRRKRGSSVTTGATIGVPVGVPLQSTPTLGAPKLTGFAIASKKRNRDFHSFFKSVPDDDYLIEDYSCALQREILAHGRLYVSEGHLCFSSNILGWTTTLVMSFDEIVSVEKRSTALVFKNGLMISTLHAKHIFASFTSRDATYDLIVNIWKLGHPTLKSSLNGVQLEGTGGDKTEKVEDEPQGLGLENESPLGSESEDGSDDDDEFYDEEEDGAFVDSQLTEVSANADVDNDKAVSRKVSAMTTLNGASGESAKDAPTSPSPGGDFPGPATHAPTECTDSGTHYDKTVGDDIIPAPLGKVYSLLFGSASATWMTKWLSEDQKCLEVTVDEKKGLTMDNNTRTWTYIKPLYASLGPKQTKCIVTENLESLDFEKSITLVLSTRTPEVPSGTLFTVKTRYCFTWAENNATRIQVNYTTEWTGKSWIKGPIEKNVNDGQAKFCEELFASAKAAVTTRGRSNTLTNGKGKKKGKKGRASLTANEGSDVSAKKIEASKTSWGPLEPIRGILEPILDILKPILTGNVMYGLLVGLLVASWFGFGFSPSKPAGGFGGGAGGRGELMDMYGPFRLAAYEEMWRREESELWEWLEERTGLGQVDSDSHGVRKRALEPRTMQERIRESRMDAREVEEAIRVTEEKLKVLRQVIANSPKQDKASEAI